MINLSDTTPAPPSGSQNVKWQEDSSGNVSAYVGLASNKTTVTPVSGAISLDASLGNSFLVVVNAAITSMAIINPTDGQELTILWAQDATGHAITLASNIVDVTAPSTAANAYSAFKITYNEGDATWYGVPTASSGSGTVTSVGVAVPSRQSVSGSPVTGSGTITISDNNQSANEVFAGPASGSAAAPGFRALQAADLPVATDSAFGAVKPDGDTITISDGVISAVGGGGGGGSVSFGSGSPYGVKFVQSAAAAPGNSPSLAFGSNVTSGNLLIVVYSSQNNTSSSTCSDTVGTTYTKALVYSPAGGEYVIVFAGLAGGSGANTVTIGTPGNSYDAIAVMEVSGAEATVDVDATYNSGSSANPIASLAATTTVAGDFLLFSFATNNSGNLTAYSVPFALTAQNSSGPGNSISVGFSYAGAAGLYNVIGFVMAGILTAVASMLVAFKPSGSPISGSSGDIYVDTSTTPAQGWVYDTSWRRLL